MIRQLGGSIGIAVINVFLIHKNAEVRGSLLGYINQYSDATKERLAGLTQTFLSKGYSTVEAEALANKMMENMIFRQQ
ncbi:MAG: MFS transporter, partial [Methylococcaceae bacterium]|nr:MFS transporter [Methylococcaceae bacterium]